MIYRRLLKVIAALAMVCFAGVSGYMVIEGWSLFDSPYMTVITIASVGYGETHPLTFGGRFFTIILILCGLAHSFTGFSFSRLRGPLTTTPSCRWPISAAPPGCSPLCMPMPKTCEESERKLRRAGADRVVMPNFIGGMCMA